jgi:hypothetical protein
MNIYGTEVTDEMEVASAEVAGPRAEPIVCDFLPL